MLGLDWNCPVDHEELVTSSVKSRNEIVWEFFLLREHMNSSPMSSSRRAFDRSIEWKYAVYWALILSTLFSYVSRWSLSLRASSSNYWFCRKTIVGTFFPRIGSSVSERLSFTLEILRTKYRRNMFVMELQIDDKHIIILCTTSPLSTLTFD